MKPVFITSTGTEIGKTLITCSLGWQLRAKGEEVRILKPIVSGFDPDDPTSDTRQILDCLGEEPNDETVGAVSPLRFFAPISPDMAARQEGKAIDFDALVGFCREAAAGERRLLIEGVGGAFVPLTNRHLVADWIAELDCRTIVVTGSYLGTLSHTIATVNALRHRGVRVTSIIVSESAESPVPLEETVAAFQHWLGGSRTYAVPRLSGDAPLWKRTPDITVAL